MVKEGFSTSYLFVSSIVVILGISFGLLVLLNQSGNEVSFSPGDILLTGCQELNISGGSYVLQNDLVVQGICFNITASDIVLDGGNNLLTGSSADSTAIYTRHLNNVSLKNLVIRNFSDSSLSFYNQTNLNLTNVIIEDPASSFSIIYFGQSNDINFYNVTLRNIPNTGIISGTGSRYTLEKLNILNSTGYGISTSGLMDNFTLIDSYITNYSFLASNGYSMDLTYFKRNIGRIDFIPQILTNGNNLSSDLQLSYNYAYINSSKVGLNKSAELTFYILSTTMNEPVILKNGLECNDCYNFTSLNAGTVIFNVSSGGNYSVVDSNPLQVIDVNEPRNKSYSLSSLPLDFDVDLSESGKVWFKIDNGSNLSMSSSDGLSFNYTYSNLSLGSHSFIAYANDSQGLDYVTSGLIYFSIINVSSSSGSGSAGSVSGGSGGSGGSVTSWTNTYDVPFDLIQTPSGYSGGFFAKSKIKFNYLEQEEYIGVVSLNGTEALIESSGDPYRQTIGVSQAYNFDMDDDGSSDIEVSVLSISSNEAQIGLRSIQSLAELTTNEPDSTGAIQGAEQESNSGSRIFWAIFSLLGAVILIALVYAIVTLIRKSEDGKNLS